MKIFIARHGERIDLVDPSWKLTAENPHDAPLTKVGHEQARELGHHLREENIKHIFASPFYRTVQTAHGVSQVLNLDLKLESGACEWLNRDWYGARAPQWKTADEIMKEMQNVDVSYSAFGDVVFPETKVKLRERAKRTVSLITDNYLKGDGNILIVGHGSSVEAMVLGLVPGVQMEWVTYCSLTECVRKPDGTFEVARMCDTSFLTNPEDASTTRYV